MKNERPLGRWIRKARTVPWGLNAAGERLLFYASLMHIQSELRIDVIIPAAPKDLATLPYCIDGVQRNVRHPIPNIFVIAPESDEIEDVCRRKHCTFVHERGVVDIDPHKIGLVVNGVDRSTWIYQQFLKWSADSVAQSSYYLVIDADTVFVRPQVFERNGKIIFNYSDEYYVPYFDMYQRLLQETVRFPSSFTSHQMLYDKSILAELKSKVEAIHGCDWQQAILRNLDRSEWSAFSDYDTYGQYVFLHHPGPMAIEYWFNLDLKRRKNLEGVGILGLKYGGKYKSVSFHSYNE